MNTKVFFVLAILAVAAADKRPSTSYGPPAAERRPSTSYGAPVAESRPSASYGIPQQSHEAEEESFEYSSASDESSEPVKYDFQFEVKDEYSGSDFQHQESRDEDNTKGFYSVQLPDGRLQKVSYHVEGDSGYIADVSYEGEAQYPESAESREHSAAPRPTYSAPAFDESQEQSYATPRRAYGVPQ